MHSKITQKGANDCQGASHATTKGHLLSLFIHLIDPPTFAVTSFQRHHLHHPNMSPNRRFDVNDNLIMRAVPGEGGERQQHVSSDVALEMEKRKNARLEARRMKDLMKALTGVDNGGASKNKTRAKAKEMPAIDKTPRSTRTYGQSIRFVLPRGSYTVFTSGACVR